MNGQVIDMRKEQIRMARLIEKAKKLRGMEYSGKVLIAIPTERPSNEKLSNYIIADSIRYVYDMLGCSDGRFGEIIK